MKLTCHQSVSQHGYSLEADLKHVKSLGTIEVNIFHENVVGEVPRATFLKFEEVDILSEKALKGQAIDHSGT